MSLKVGVLGSTRGSALQGVLDAIAAGTLDVEIVLVVSDKQAAPILERAARHGVRALFLDPAGLTREAYDQQVSKALRDAGAELVLMIGYMRIVSDQFINTWRGRLLNVHPSLLPAFGGLMNLKVHEAVLAAGVSETGCTIHQVTEEVDGGPIVLQKRCPVMPGDTAEILQSRVQALEQAAFVEVLQKVEEMMAEATKKIDVGILMGSKSDWPAMEAAARVLDELGIAYEAQVISAHRTPDQRVAVRRERQSARAARDYCGRGRRGASGGIRCGQDDSAGARCPHEEQRAEWP